MTLEFLNKEIVNAMKNGDTVTKDVLRSAVGNIKKAAIDKGMRDDIAETLVDEVLLKEKKTLQEMIDTCPADRVETLELYKAKMTVLNCYVPQIITDEKEVMRLIVEICKDMEVRNKGLIMKAVTAQLKGKIDMKVANKVVTDLMNGAWI